MSEHLTLEQIGQYVSRVGGVDDILAAAEHLEDCDDCRDLASGLVTLESTVEGGARSGRAAAAAASRRRLMFWVGTAVLALVVLAFFVLQR